VDEISATNVLWPLADNQGTIRDITNNAGAIQNHITYNSFGRIISQTNPNVYTRFNYTGRELDGETGMYYYRSRYYDCVVGRFISEDAIGFNGNDVNLYRYVRNSPVNYLDPLGLLTIVIPGGFGKTGNLPQNIADVGQYTVITLGDLGFPGPDISGVKARRVLSQVAPIINKGLRPGEPIVIIAHSDGNQLVQPIINAIRGAQGIPIRPGFGKKPDRCANPDSIVIQVGRLDPTGIAKPTGANQVIDVGSNVLRAWVFTRESSSNTFLKPDFRAPLGVDHDGLLDNKTVVTTLQKRYGFGF
jgi:RHS repeat-associated protein